MFDNSLQSDFIRLAAILCARKLRLCVAESCTGGWFGKICTDLAGSSQWFEAGWITYSNAAKQTLLHVPVKTVNTYGAVSEETVSAMVRGALDCLPTASVAVAVSGIAGPEGGSLEKPVGLVWFAWQLRGDTVQTQWYQYTGDRHAVRMQAVRTMLAGTLCLLDDGTGNEFFDKD